MRESVISPFIAVYFFFCSAKHLGSKRRGHILYKYGSSREEHKEVGWVSLNNVGPPESMLG